MQLRYTRGTERFLAQLKLAVVCDGWSLKLRERPFPFRGRLAGWTWPAEESVSRAEIRRKANSLASLWEHYPCVPSVIFDRPSMNVLPHVKDLPLLNIS